MGKSDTDWLDDIDSPILPDDKVSKSNYHDSGWRFYIKLRPYLAEYWRQFNSDLNSKGKSKYRTVDDFIKAKFKSKTERELFYLMTCSEAEWEIGASLDNSKKKAIPWLGDWYKRRKNGYWNEDNGFHTSYLKKAIKEGIESSQAIKATAPFLIQSLMRWNRMQAKIDEAYGGQLFLDEAPNTPKNKSRFEAYTKMCKIVEGMKIKLMNEWMRVHGVNPNDPQQMFNMSALAQGFAQAGAAGALSGVAAAQGFMLSNPNGQAPTMLSRDALLLADHLTSHTKSFKEMPKDVVIDHEPDKKKTNGKHSTQ